MCCGLLVLERGEFAVPPNHGLNGTRRRGPVHTRSFVIVGAARR